MTAPSTPTWAPPRRMTASGVDYVEGIYVGYRWYETAADAEGFWNDVSNEHGRGLRRRRAVSFGYGLSYTNFSWEVVYRSSQVRTPRSDATLPTRPRFV